MYPWRHKSAVTRINKCIMPQRYSSLSVTKNFEYFIEDSSGGLKVSITNPGTLLHAANPESLMQTGSGFWTASEDERKD